MFNILETHLVSPQRKVFQKNQEQDDIISLDGSNSEIEVVYQKDTTFTDIAFQIATPNLITMSTHTLRYNLLQTFPHQNLNFSLSLKARLLTMLITITSQT